MECYSNQKWGMAYPVERMDATGSFLAAALWSEKTVTFSHTHADGEVESSTSRRTLFDVIMEGRPAHEQVEDICRSGGIAIPFQHEGLFHTREFRAATSGELSAARVFTDRGEGRNIIWDGNKPSIEFSVVPDDKLPNRIMLNFEQADNGEKDRPINIEDRNQQVIAGRTLGGDHLQKVDKKFAAFGIRNIAEVIRFGYRLLRFGQFDEGGTQNNLRAEFTTHFEFCLGLKRYEIIKIESDLLDGTGHPTFDGFKFPDASAIEYFRILKIEKIGGHRAKLLCQAYNHTAYTAFETEVAPDPDDLGPNVAPDPDIKGNVEALTMTASYDNTNKQFEVIVS